MRSKDRFATTIIRVCGANKSLERRNQKHRRGIKSVDLLPTCVREWARGRQHSASQPRRRRQSRSNSLSRHSDPRPAKSISKTVSAKHWTPNSDRISAPKKCDDEKDRRALSAFRGRFLQKPKTHRIPERRFSTFGLGLRTEKLKVGT